MTRERHTIRSSAPTAAPGRASGRRGGETARSGTGQGERVGSCKCNALPDRETARSGPGTGQGERVGSCKPGFNGVARRDEKQAISRF